MEKYLVSNEKKFQPHLTSFDPSKNRINKIGQIQPKCLRNYAWKMMMWHIVLEIKSGKAKLWKSICLVMKKKFQPDLTSFDPSKKLSAKIALKLYFRKNWGTKSVFSHYVHKLVRKSTFHILYIKLYINLFKIHCFWFFQQNFVLKFGWNWVQTMVHPSV